MLSELQLDLLDAQVGQVAGRALLGPAEAEAHRALLKAELLSKDEGALFQIANQFGIRHRNANQQANFPDEYLDWLFHWYPATVDLIRRIAPR